MNKAKALQVAKNLTFWHLWLLAIVVIYFSIIMHEAAHWAILQILGCQPTMGFTGIIQQWDTPPNSLDGWQAITYPTIGTGWLRMEQLPQTSLQWGVMLISGQSVPLLLIILGIFWYYRKPPQFAVVALMVVFINGAMAITKIIGWWQGNLGDLYFFSLHTGVPYPILNGSIIGALGSGLVWSLRQLPCPVRRRWMRALVVAYAGTLPLLMWGNALILQLIDSTSLWGKVFWGWALPVWVVTLVIFVGGIWWIQSTRTYFKNSQE